MLPARAQHPALHLTQAGGGHPNQLDRRKTVLILDLTRATDHTSAAQVRQIVGEGDEGLHHLDGVGDVLLPLDLLALPAGQLAKVDHGVHGGDSCT